MQPAATNNTRQPTPPTVRVLAQRNCKLGRRWSTLKGCRAASSLLEHACAEAQPAASSRLQSLRLITAIKTPYLPSGRFDLRAFDKIVENQVYQCSIAVLFIDADAQMRSSICSHSVMCSQIALGVDGLIIGGTTGEGQLMSWDEHIMLIAHTVNR